MVCTSLLDQLAGALAQLDDRVVVADLNGPPARAERNPALQLLDRQWAPMLC
jgi:hypothetical protein